MPTPDRLEILVILLGCGLLTLALMGLFSVLMSGFTWSNRERAETQMPDEEG